MMLKRGFKSVCFFLLVLCLMGCDRNNNVINTSSDNNEATTTVNDEDTAARMEGHAEGRHDMALSEAGIIYGDNSGRVHLVTIDEGKDMLLCYNPNCSHQDKNCMAYEGAGNVTMYYNGVIYYFEMSSFYEHRIYKWEPDAAGRELIAELPFDFETWYVCIFHNDKVYYTAKIVREEESNGGIKTLSTVYRMVEVSLLDGSYRFITEESTGIMNNVTLIGNTIYTRRYEEDGSLNMAAVDIDTLEYKTIITQETWNKEYVYVSGYDEDSYFYGDRSPREIGIRSLDGTVERVLIKGAENERYSNMDAYANGIYYSRMYDYEDEPAGHYFLDLVTGEVTNITDEVEKYNIREYDGYYDAFINSLLEPYGMWSREKIINEAKAGE